MSGDNGGNHLGIDTKAGLSVQLWPNLSMVYNNAIMHHDDAVTDNGLIILCAVCHQPTVAKYKPTCANRKSAKKFRKSLIRPQNNTFAICDFHQTTAVFAAPFGTPRQHFEMRPTGWAL